MDLKTSLLAAADAHCRATGMSKARLATLLANDGKFFDRVERGGGITLKTYEQCMGWLAGLSSGQITTENLSAMRRERKTSAVAA